MMTVHEVSRISGVSIRTLHHYDNIGLLPATEVTAAGYRMYDENALERLQQILLFKELEFPLKDIKEILNRPDFDRRKALEQQIHLLELKKEHLENLIRFAVEIKMTGDRKMDFETFHTKKMDEYTKQVKESWGETEAFKEYQEKKKERSAEDENMLGKQLMDIFAEFAKVMDKGPDSEDAIAIAKQIQDFISENYYECTNQILATLGSMYSGGGDMTDNINQYAGEGVAEFADRAIQAYLSKA